MKQTLKLLFSVIILISFIGCTNPYYYSITYNVEYINNSDYDITIISTTNIGHVSDYETPILIKKGESYFYNHMYSQEMDPSFSYLLASEAILEYASSDGNKIKVKYYINSTNRTPHNFCRESHYERVSHGSDDGRTVIVVYLFTFTNDDYDWAVDNQLKE